MSIARPLPRPSAPAPAEPQATLVEVFSAAAAGGAATGFVLTQVEPGTVLWVQDRLSLREGGRPCAMGIAEVRGAWLDLLHLEVARPVGVLWAMEEALGCSGLAAVIGEVWGEPSVLDFTATKRLALRAEAGGVQAWLVRRAASPDLSAARERWRVASLPSLPHPEDARAPGEALWRATLFHSRRARVSEWTAGPGSPGRGPILARRTEQDNAEGQVGPVRADPKVA